MIGEVQLLISHLPRRLRTRRFSEPTFRPSGATKHWKNTVFETFLPFLAPGSSFFWLFLFSDSSHLCFSICRVHIVGSLTSKLPSITNGKPPNVGTWGPTMVKSYPHPLLGSTASHHLLPLDESMDECPPACCGPDGPPKRKQTLW